VVASLLFDTNIVIDILAGVPDARRQYESCTEPAMSIITWMEVMVGVQPEEEEKILRFLATFIRFPLSLEIATKAIEVRRTSRLKLPDAIIFATALVEGRVLLTRNTRDFEPDAPNIRIPYRL
jgi:predicted nucleic acid-binding protein